MVFAIALMIGAVFLLLIAFNNDRSTKSSPTNKPAHPTSKPTPTSVAYDLNKLNKQQKEQEEDRKRLEEQRRLEETERKDQLRKQEQEKKRKEEERRQLEAIRLQEQRKAEEAVLNTKISTFKPNWKDFQVTLIQNNIKKLYHFTDSRNIDSIKRHRGLYSWDYCKRNNIEIPYPGGSDTSWILDKNKGLENYVRASFVKDHPMMFVAQKDGRIARPVILEINPEIVYLRSTKFAIQNAAKNGIRADSTLEKFNAIKFPILKSRYFDLSPDEKPYYQAEVLILEALPLEYIININHF